jgi:putative hydrolase of the HAD superfamily
MIISTIFFDIGKVLVDYDFEPVFQKVAEVCGLSKDETGAILYGGQELWDYENGLISTEAFFQHLKTKLSYPGSIEELQFLWCDVFMPLEDHIQLARQLAQYYPMALISNTCDAHIRFIEERYDFFSLFKERIYSHEVHCRKPDLEIYNIALERMKGDRFEALFIDDREENIITPSRNGWQTIHLRNDVNLLHALQSYDLQGI